ncbi:MAG: radical SAM protein [Chitinivibrionales bacterium]|nr:radical SAM protein [Chitinivibrionales bacterium]
MPGLPGYLTLDASDWDTKIAAADELARECRLCPRACGVDRLSGEKGFCRAPAGLHLSSIFAHHGEEPPLSGSGGSGTVFFSHCTLRCVFCQNHQLSHGGQGRSYTVDELAQRMVLLQDEGCHNVNLVTSGHYLPWVLRAIRRASANGLEIPIVYNCGGYEVPEALAIMDRVIDIYLPDMKYADGAPARQFSAAPDYVAINREAIRCMFRQVGPLRLDCAGIAYRGMCIRHLVLPNGLAGSEQIAAFLAAGYDPSDIAISLMAQYRPLHLAGQYTDIARRPTREEYRRARRAFESAGFEGFYQDGDALDESFVFDFKVD